MKSRIAKLAAVATVTLLCLGIPALGGPPGPPKPPGPPVPVVRAPEGGAAWLYLILAALVCFGALYLRSKLEARTAKRFLTSDR